MPRGKPQKYFLTEQGKQLLLSEYDGRSGTVDRLSRELGAPPWRIWMWAKQYHVSEPWRTKRHNAYIERVYCHLPLSVIAHKQKRSTAAVRRDAYRMGINKLSEGYTITSLSMATGCHHSVITRWIKRGWLTASRRRAKQTHDYWYISDSAVYHLLTQYKQDINMDRVDPLWLKDVLAGPYGLGVLSVE